MHNETATTQDLQSSFAREVTGRVGVLPNFFRSADAAPGLNEQLWSFAKTAYLDNPLPGVFKERLFVYLSRFCEVRYCIVRHVGFLAGLGRPASDGSVSPHTLEQVITLLQRPIPNTSELDTAIGRLESQPAAAGAPAPETPVEWDLLDALAVIFLEPRRSARARSAVRSCIGEPGFECAMALLAFVRTAHFWAETHPEITYEPDLARLMEAHPELARLLLRDAEGDGLLSLSIAEMQRHADETMPASLAEKEELLKEVHHRVKNNLQVIISLLNLQARQIDNGDVLNVFEETRNRIQSIASIHELLYHGESFAHIQMSVYARRIAPDLVRFYGIEERVNLQIAGEGAAIELERAVPYGMLLNELVSNACKHAFPEGRDGQIVITIQPHGNEIELSVADNGKGLPPGFDYQRSSSLGLKLVHGLIRQLRGNIEVRSEDGTVVTVRFPPAEESRK